MSGRDFLAFGVEGFGFGVECFGFRVEGFLGFRLVVEGFGERTVYVCSFRL